jgi:glycosyltransferase involved in cell wall biosynthesis
MAYITGGRSDTGRAEAPQLWLSILIPVYNVEPYLRECVFSIIHQQLDNGVEIILLDDCSTDSSWQICIELAEQFPNYIRLLQHDQNRGISTTRNALVDAAKGEYIWFLDSDDYLIESSIEQLRKILDKRRPDVILFDYRKQGYPFKKSFPGFSQHFGTSRQKLIAGVFAYRKIYPWLKISKRALWTEDLRFPDGKVYEDIATIPRLLLRCDSYYYVPRAWIFYRVRPNSIMTSVARTKNFFDINKNDDLASAMLGFPQQLARQQGGSASAYFYVSHFVAKEYCKLAKRFVSAARASANLIVDHPTPMLNKYLDKMENSSPLKFCDLRRAYLKRLRLWDYYALTRAIAAARKPAVHA